MSSKTKRRAKIESDSDDMGSSDIEQVCGDVRHVSYRNKAPFSKLKKLWEGAKRWRVRSSHDAVYQSVVQDVCSVHHCTPIPTPP